MEYNTTRSKLLMPEYGRNVQRMVEYLLTIEDRATRLRNAEAVIELMGTLNPHLKVIEDYKHKLWDHLYQMTDFQLDVDSPYPSLQGKRSFKSPKYCLIRRRRYRTVTWVLTWKTCWEKLWQSRTRKNARDLHRPSATI